MALWTPKHKLNYHDYFQLDTGTSLWLDRGRLRFLEHRSTVVRLCVYSRTVLKRREVSLVCTLGDNALESFGVQKQGNCPIARREPLP
jgi:hypothetical protein